MVTEAGLGRGELDPSPVWGSFQWFAYVDPQASEAHAVSLSLGLYVSRPTLQEAADELQALAVDYIRIQRNPETKPEDLHRGSPPEAWEIHTNLFCERLLSHPEERGAQWTVGSYVVSADGEITVLQKKQRY